MEKTKLGVSAGFLCAAAYLLFLFGGYTPALLLVGYILICENDETLRISALTATILALAFSLLNLLIGLLPDILNIFESMLDIFNVYLNLNLIHRLSNLFSNTLVLLRNAAYVVFAVLAIVGKPLKIGFVAKLLK